MISKDTVRIYWHRKLPPLDAELMGEGTVEATSGRVAGTLAHRDELWKQCYEQLMTQANERLEQEVGRLGGTCGHVLDESVDSRHDPVSGQAWLHGRFTCVVYKEPNRILARTRYRAEDSLQDAKARSDPLITRFLSLLQQLLESALIRDRHARTLDL